MLEIYSLKNKIEEKEARKITWQMNNNSEINSMLVKRHRNAVERAIFLNFQYRSWKLVMDCGTGCI